MRVQLLLDGVAMYDSGERDPSPTMYKALAVAWCGMTDDQQAQFFEECARIMRDAGYIDAQSWYIGRHMRTCSCIGDGARELLGSILRAMNVEPPRG